MALDRSVIKNMGLLLQGQLATNIGGQIYDVVLLLWLKELTGSAAIMGLALLATNLPETVLAPLGGKISDRYGGVKTMVVSDLVSGLILCSVLAVVISGTGPELMVAALCVGNIVLGVSGACFAPAVSSLIPALAPRHILAKANAAQQLCRVGGRLLGQGGGGFVFTLFGPAGALALNAASFFISALTESFIRTPIAGEPKPPLSAEKKSLLRETGNSLAKLWRDEDLRRLTSYIGFFHLALSSLPITMPFYAEHILALEPGWFGFLIAAYILGIMAGFTLVGLINLRLSRMSLISSAGAFVGLLFIALGAVSSFLFAGLILILIGMGIGVIIVNLMTELQIRAPESERGGIVGAAHAVGGASLPLGMALTGIIIDSLHALGVNYGLIVRSIVVASGSASLILGLGRLRLERGRP